MKLMGGLVPWEVQGGKQMQLFEQAGEVGRLRAEGT